MDALTLSMSHLAATPALLGLAATAMAVGVLANTLLKLGVVVAVGVGGFRRKTGVWLSMMAGASVLGLWLGTR
jgi:hypothetical protein